MEIKELLVLNSEGLFPGPGESEEDFIRRVKSTKESFHSQESAIPSHHWQWASEQLRALYDFSPRWCSAFYSSKGLAPWQAAATWIAKCPEKSDAAMDVKPIYLIQLRPARWVSWLIDRNELLAHEAVHAARAAFNEPKTEELFAYLTSTSKWRQVIGPLFSRPIESLAFIGIFGLGAILQMIEAIWEFSLFSEGCFFTAALLCLAWGFRLFRMRARVARAAKNLAPLLRDPDKIRAVLFRMSDHEIIQLSRGDGVEEKSELRWQLIKAAYWKY